MKDGKFSVVGSVQRPDLAPGLAALFDAQWPGFEIESGLLNSVQVPQPLLALDSRAELIGGLAFSSYTNPKRDGFALWINGVLVVPEYRRCGVANALVAQAAGCGQQQGADEMFVLSAYTGLYQQLGWRLVEPLETHARTEAATEAESEPGERVLHLLLADTLAAKSP